MIKGDLVHTVSGSFDVRYDFSPVNLRTGQQLSCFLAPWETLQEAFLLRTLRSPAPRGVLPLPDGLAPESRWANCSVNLCYPLVSGSLRDTRTKLDLC